MIDSRKRTSRTQTIFTFLVIAVVGIIVWQFAAFQYALARMPSGWTVAGAPAAGQTPQQIVLKLQTAFSQTVTLHYRSETLTLDPQDVDFRLDEAATLQSLNDVRTDAGGAQGFLQFMIHRTPPPRDVPAVATYSEEKLRASLTRVAERYDQAPTSPTPLLDELRFAQGQPGNELDISSSVPVIAAALRSANKREANLVVKTVPPIQPRLKLLRDLIEAYVERTFNGQAGVFVKDLQTGEEIGINDGVAFSGMSLLKVPILTETYRRLSGTPDEATLTLISQTATGETSNGSANTLLQRLGDNDAYAGADRLNASMRYLGLVNTFVATPYDQNITPPAVVTQANSRPDISTNPDPRMQTTPQDMGLLLEMVYLCARGGGTLMIAYPNAFTPSKCSQLLDLLSRGALTNPSGSAPMFIRAGLPTETRMAQKWGFDKDTRANSAVIFGPTGDFILVIFLRRADWGDWQQASPIMADITRASYDYFGLAR